MVMFNAAGGFPAEHKHNTEDPQCELGSLWPVGDVVWRYVRAAAAITAGSAVISDVASETVANITGSSSSTDRARGIYPYIEDSGESWTENIYRGCLLYVNGGTGAGQLKRIKWNNSTRAYYSAMYPYMGEADPFSTDVDTTSDIVIISPYHVKTAPVTTKTNLVMGVAPFAFTSGYYGFIVAAGPALAKVGGAIAAVGTAVNPGDDTAGTLVGSGVGDDVGDVTTCGHALHVGAEDQATPIMFSCIRW